MDKKLVLLLSAIVLAGGIGFDTMVQAATGPFGYDLKKDIYRSKSKPKSWETNDSKQQTQTAKNKKSSQKAGTSTTEDTEESEVSVFLDKYEINPAYFPNANMKSIRNKYNKGNYTGALQELYSLLKKEPENAQAYYYLAMTYTKLGETETASTCYEKVINLSNDATLTSFARRGQACLTNDAACTGAEVSLDGLGKINDTLKQGDANSDAELDAFINAPYGNGLSPALNKELRDRQLDSIQKKINENKPLSEKDLEKLEEYNKTELTIPDRIAMVTDMPSNDEIINAVQVLKRAGLNISTELPQKTDGVATSTPTNVETMTDAPSVQATNPYMPDPQIQQMSMMLNGGNSYNADPMMTMLPYMMQNDGKNMNPQVIQSMMMNSMMNSLNSMNSTNNNN